MSTHNNKSTTGWGKLILGIALGALLLFLSRQFIWQPAPYCCSAATECNISAPQNLSATLDSTTLTATWSASTDPSINYYLVQVYDVEENQQLASKNVAATDSSAIFESISDTVNPADLRVTLNAVCSNCAVSAMGTATGVCDIVIEDVIMMMPKCLNAGCDCDPGTEVANGPGPTVNFGGGGLLNLFKITVTDPGGRSAWFVIQTDRGTPGKLIVNRPDFAAIRDACPAGEKCTACESFDAPHESSCGEMDNKNLDYELDFTLGNFTLSSSVAGTNFTVEHCTDCRND